ncbi:hypothetical protein HAX54_023721, partial [Datura stramonium]|nr:hypothetical protein [Datura stramonium]
RPRKEKRKVDLIEEGNDERGDSGAKGSPSRSSGPFKCMEMEMTTIMELLSVPGPSLCGALGGLRGTEEKEELVGQIDALDVKGDEESPKDLSSPFEAPKGDQRECLEVLVPEWVSK